ncbi:MAG: glycosyltransferase family 4 protein [Flavobacteriaceae bacterium]|jgi:glycosyltransferase involved in cell wall biosynthesis|nr:glycosyltransferase family 4 protein [Flavobacteriaceae bacterium]MBT4113426.1 glycosyltransferase family 4 protein [Flavobacteriaceae bacterium]MBT4613526.1 glycosyltransferase family 4 protein [Flavobacteriaceae bacterium]MBT5246244.1 glycosyltransferase family 4 protein [Flavobacteriaceae bacterium]MBT5650450.1 glycosyltransferase family 4 protein [Flavobacteriaceae bacterium]
MKQLAKRVLVLHSSNDMYGASRIVLQVIDILIKAKYEVHVILPYKGVLNKIITDKGASCSIYNLGVFRKIYLNLNGLYNRFLKIKNAKNHISNYIDKHHIDLLYTSTSVIISGGLAAKKSGIPSISHIHEIPTVNKSYEIFIALFVRYFSKKVIVVSNSVAKHWQPYLKKKQLLKVYNGIVFPLTEVSEYTKRKIGQDITVTSIGRLIPGKGHKYFIEAAKELLKLNNQYQFLIVGDTFPGYESYEEELKTLVIENDLHEKIHFLGYRADIEAILAKSDLLFHSSITPDSLPTVLFEAIKMKVPLAATELAGAVEILDNGNCGLLLPLNNAKKVAELINDYIKDENLKISNIEKAIEYTNLHFSPTQFEKNILDIFKITLTSK